MASEEEQQPAPEYSAVYRPQQPFDKAPFDSSAFDQRPFADRVVQGFDILGQGAVIAIDAPWGHGKTFFGRNLHGDLSGKGWKTVYIDAFETDYVEDPFVLLASTIKDEASEGKKRQSLIKSASAVGKALLPITAKAVARAVTAGVLTGEQLEEAGKAISDASGDLALKLVEGRIRDFEKDRQSVATFKKSIAELAGSIRTATGHPLVIFIDELDRCRPDFAVRMLERMKHFFDVPSLVFVLLLNKAQLEGAVNGVYGAAIDAESYLRKFIHLTFELPIRLSTKDESRSELRTFVGYLAGKIHLGENQALVQPCAQTLSELAPTFGMSLRDVERCFTVFVVSALNAKIGAHLVPFFTFIIVLKTVYPSIYEGLIQKRREARQAVGDLLSVAAERGLKDFQVQAFDGMLAGYMGVEVSDEFKRYFQQVFFRYHIELENMFPVLAGILDARLAR
jgi:hypothetical protein